MAHQVRALMLALQYFTRMPLPDRLLGWTGFDAGLQRASLAHFPGVGWLVGAVAATSYAVVQQVLPASMFAHLAAAVAATIATVWLTGALHEDGLADTVDGLATGTDRQRILATMKDSRVGAAGALALAMALLAKVALLSCIGAAAGWTGAAAALLGAHVVSRGMSLGIVATLPHIGHAAASKSLPVAGQVGRAGLAIAAVWCIAALSLAASLASPAACFVALAFAAAMLLCVRFLLARRLAGYTGDGLGATQQLCEIAFCLGMSVSV